MRVVFDVNVLIRAVMRSPMIARILAKSAEARHTILISELLLAELAECARKPRLAQHMDWQLYNDLLVFLATTGEHVAIAPPFPACRDPDDGYLLAMARDGAADVLVTADHDLLSMSNIGSCRITTPEQFESEFLVGPAA